MLLGAQADLSRAQRLFREASDAGIPEGKRGLAFMLMNGVGSPKDPTSANRLFMEAAEAGDGYSAYNLAVNYYNGVGVHRNAREFLRWLQRAANDGIPEACALLGDTLSAQHKDQEALECYVRAASSGHAPAMFVAGGMYRDGVGTEPDRVQAVRWFLTMLDRVNGDGVHEALQLAPSMSADEIREAGRLAGRPEDAELLIRSGS